MTGTAQREASRGSQQGTESPVAITVNGSRRELSGQTSVADLLSMLSLDARGVVVEHNGLILRDRDSLPSVALSNGDVVEIVHFVGGG